MKWFLKQNALNLLHFRRRCDLEVRSNSVQLVETADTKNTLPWKDLPKKAFDRRCNVQVFIKSFNVWWISFEYPSYIKTENSVIVMCNLDLVLNNHLYKLWTWSQEELPRDPTLLFNSLILLWSSNTAKVTESGTCRQRLTGRLLCANFISTFAILKELAIIKIWRQDGRD